jgi:nucleoside-diphosphate-sugar epimerase
MTTRTVFVTGGSGFVGGHLIEALVARGDRVLALARSASSEATVRRFGAEPVKGDLGSLTAAQLAGVDAVVHSAAFVEEWGTREEFWEANVDGTTRVLDAARNAGVRRFVHVGTEAGLFDGHDLLDIDEDVDPPRRHLYPYSETKAEAERRVLAASSPSFETIVIRPRLVWGPRDASVIPAILAMARAGKFVWLDGGRALSSTTHVANLVHALVLALDRGKPGRAYFVADDGTRTMRSFLGAAAAAHGVDLGTRSIPSRVARPLAAAIDGAWRRLGIRRPPPMTRFAIDMMSSSVTLRTDRARAELGWAPVITVEEGLRQLG